MLEIDGEKWLPKSVSENTTELIDYINDYCANKSITNTLGETIYIESNKASPLFLMCQALGYQLTELQNLVASAASSLSIGQSTDTQLVNLAALAGVQRRGATKTSFTAVIYAEEDTDCAITTLLTVTMKSGSTSVVFSPAYDYTIAAGSSHYMMFVADVYGSFNISANAITDFDENPEGFRQMVSFASVPGQSIESIASLRRRILARNDGKTWLSKVEEAITSLDGVTWCSAYYNSTNVDETINDVTVEARHVLLTIQGYSDNIASTYFQYCCAPTTGSESERAVTQNYEAQIGQSIPVYFLIPRYVSPWIQIYVQGTVNTDLTQQIQDAVSLLSGELNIGAALLSTDVVNKLASELPDVTVIGVQVSLDGGEFSYKCAVESDQLITFENEHILVAEAA